MINCHGLKLKAADGKMRMTDVADQEQLFHLIQSIPSPKAEPFKQWMAQVASTRIDQMQDPELDIQQAVADYKRHGYSDNWINQRIKSIEVRKELTDIINPVQRQAITCRHQKMQMQRNCLRINDLTKSLSQIVSSLQTISCWNWKTN